MRNSNIKHRLETPELCFRGLLKHLNTQRVSNLRANFVLMILQLANSRRPTPKMYHSVPPFLLLGSLFLFINLSNLLLPFRRRIYTILFNKKQKRRREKKFYIWQILNIYLWTSCWVNRKISVTFRNVTLEHLFTRSECTFVLQIKREKYQIEMRHFFN